MAEREQRLDEGAYQPEQPVLCANNCGFFGNPMCMNLCSKCYRDYTEQQKAAASIEQAATEGAIAAEEANAAKQRGGDHMMVSPSGSESTSGSSSSRAMVTESSAGPSTSLQEQQQVPSIHGERQSSELQQVRDERGSAAMEGGSVAMEGVATSSGMSEDSLPERKVRKQRNRCFSCNKRVGLTGFPCRCGYVYCAVHRYSDKHNCAYDYKAAGRDAIAKANPTVVATKIEKI
ncbi:hypothetical protein CBR_g34255 [Chara braunii]|uniref:AN1-type domain-containing protein n=1 Tax=Chara braunii TaxID=69332 RepID=A0A388JYU5_CHABU|nr:hypothetical protein CBR_g34255 [Chara braunii]|eukprot:GBG62883.1 hypothetical protein CBR_g34255 [Chara braunii]